MSCEWVSYTGKNSDFWSHEWSTHGTCALSLLPTQEDYFNTTIMLNNEYDPNVSDFSALPSSNSFFIYLSIIFPRQSMLRRIAGTLIGRWNFTELNVTFTDSKHS